MIACPPVGSTRVVSTPIVVVLPAPFGPSRPKTSPRLTMKLMPLTALTGLRGYCFSSPSTMMMVSRDLWTAECVAVIGSELMVCDFPFAPELLWKRPLICHETNHRQAVSAHEKIARHLSGEIVAKTWRSIKRGLRNCRVQTPARSKQRLLEHHA